MAAATATVAKEIRSIPHRVMEIQLSSLTSDQTESLTHGGPAFKPDEVSFEMLTPPTALCAITPMRVTASDSTTICAVKFVAENGGDLAGAVYKVRMTFYSCKDGGIG